MRKIKTHWHTIYNSEGTYAEAFKVIATIKNNSCETIAIELSEAEAGALLNSLRETLEISLIERK